MADATTKRSYPKLPAKNWWTLRERFKGSIPQKVDADYLQSVLSLSTPGSAANLIGPLRTVGLIDDSGSTTDRALDWRDDSTYPAVCAAIVADIYPDTLRSAFPEPAKDTEGVLNWFSRNTGAGRSASTAMAGFYTLLTEADPAKVASKPNEAPKKRSKPASAPKPTRAKAKGTSATENDVVGKPPRTDPEVSISLQIHIDPTASAEQIDQIFKSMAVHLYGES